MAAAYANTREPSIGGCSRTVRSGQVGGYDATQSSATRLTPRLPKEPGPTPTRPSDPEGMIRGTEIKPTTPPAGQGCETGPSSKVSPPTRDRSGPFARQTRRTSEWLSSPQPKSGGANHPCAAVRMVSGTRSAALPTGKTAHAATLAPSGLAARRALAKLVRSNRSSMVATPARPATHTTRWDATGRWPPSSRARLDIMKQRWEQAVDVLGPVSNRP
jgi:hypothetical protein